MMSLSFFIGGEISMCYAENSVKNALASMLNYPDIKQIHSHHHLKKDLQLDSMNALMLLMRLEDHIDGFYVDPETFQLSDLETVSSLVNYINLQISSRNFFDTP